MYNFSIQSLATKGMAKRGGKQVAMVRLYIWEGIKGVDFRYVDIRELRVDHAFYKEVDYMITKGYTMLPPPDLK